MNKYLIPALIVLAVFTAGAVYLFNFEPVEEAIIVTITDEGYSPNKLDIKKNQTVIFVNNATDARWPASAIHPSHQVYPEFDPKEPVPAGESWSFKFDRVGSWRFHDHLLPDITGVVNVTE